MGPVGAFPRANAGACAPPQRRARARRASRIGKSCGSLRVRICDSLAFQGARHFPSRRRHPGRAGRTPSLPCSGCGAAPPRAGRPTLRTGAPQSPGLAGAAAGLLAGGLAATLYAVHCPDGSPLFVALWYLPVVIWVTQGPALGIVASGSDGSAASAAAAFVPWPTTAPRLRSGPRFRPAGRQPRRSEGRRDYPRSPCSVFASPSLGGYAADESVRVSLCRRANGSRGSACSAREVAVPWQQCALRRPLCSEPARPIEKPSAQSGWAFRIGPSAEVASPLGHRSEQPNFPCAAFPVASLQRLASLHPLSGGHRSCAQTQHGRLP